MQPKRKEALVLWIHTSLQASSPYLPTFNKGNPIGFFFFFFSRQNKTELFRGSQIQIVYVKPTEFVSLWNKKELLWGNPVRNNRSTSSVAWASGSNVRTSFRPSNPRQCPHHLQHNSIKSSQLQVSEEEKETSTTCLDICYCRNNILCTHLHILYSRSARCHAQMYRLPTTVIKASRSLTKPQHLQQ